MEKRVPKTSSILAVILASYMMIAIDISIVNIALPSIRVNLGFSAVTLSWVVNAYMLAYGGLLFLGGRTGDVLGRRRILFAGVAIFTFASALGGLASFGWWLLAARALQGVGAALVAPSTMALLTASFPEGEARNRALSVYAMAITFGIVIGLMLGGVLTSIASWRWVFYVNVPVGIVLLLVVPRVLPETDARGGTLNVPSGVLATLGTVSLVYALIHGASSGFLSAGSLLAVALLVLVGAGFIVNERRTSNPLVPLSLFANRNRIAAYLGLFFLLAGNFGMFFFATQFLQGVLHFSPLQTGLAYLPMAVIMIAAARIVPRLLRRYSQRTLLLVATPLQVFSMLWLNRLGDASSYLGGVMGPVILCGIATGLSNISLTSLALSQVDRRESGAASGLTQTMISVGGSFGLAVLVATFAISTGSAGGAQVDSASLFVHGASQSFLVAAGLAAMGFLSALFLIRTPEPQRTTVDSETEREATKPAAAEGAAGESATDGAAAIQSAGAYKATVQRYFEMLSDGRHADAQGMLHPDWTDHSLGESNGIHALAGANAENDEATTGRMRIVIERMISEGDHVAVHGTVHGHHNGNEFRSRMMWFVRMQEDKLAELWSIREPEEMPS